jgi:hypothetical protein
MREFCPPEFPVYMYDKEGKYVLKTMGEVCLDPGVFPSYTGLPGAG